MRNKLVIAGLVLVSLLAASSWYLLGRGAPPDDGKLTLHGNVDIRQVSLAFNASERIAELLVREGDRVIAGQTLGRLDVRTLRLRLKQAEAQAGGSEQALARLRAGNRPEEIAQASANVSAAQADVDLAHSQFKRLQDIRDATAGRGASQQDLDSAASREKVAVEKLRAAAAAAQLMIAGPRKEDIAQARSQLDAALAESALLARQLDEAELKAPMDAVVRARLLEPGDIASPQRPVYTLAIVRPKWVRAYLAESDLPRVKVGMEANVSTDGAPAGSQPLPAKVGYISSVAEFTPKTVQTPELRTSLVYEIRVFVEDPGDMLRLGMPADVHIQTRPASSPADKP